jgi:ABC-type transport system involved in cytochrome c biogenesis ATPase subunit
MKRLERYIRVLRFLSHQQGMKIDFHVIGHLTHAVQTTSTSVTAAGNADS